MSKKKKKKKRNKITFVQQLLVQTPHKPHFICFLAVASETKKNPLRRKQDLSDV